MMLTLGLFCWSKCLSQFNPLSDQKAYCFTIKGHCPEEKKWRRVIKHESKLTPCVKGAEVVLLTPVFNWLSKEKALKDEDSSFFSFLQKHLSHKHATETAARACASAGIRRAGAQPQHAARTLLACAFVRIRAKLVGSFCEKRTRHAQKRSLHYQKEDSLLC